MHVLEADLTTGPKNRQHTAEDTQKKQNPFRQFRSKNPFIYFSSSNPFGLGMRCLDISFNDLSNNPFLFATRRTL